MADDSERERRHLAQLEAHAHGSPPNSPLRRASTNVSRDRRASALVAPTTRDHGQQQPGKSAVSVIKARERHRRSSTSLSQRMRASFSARRSRSTSSSENAPKSKGKAKRKLVGSRTMPRGPQTYTALDVDAGLSPLSIPAAGPAAPPLDTQKKSPSPLFSTSATSSPSSATSSSLSLSPLLSPNTVSVSMSVSSATTLPRIDDLEATDTTATSVGPSHRSQATDHYLTPQSITKSTKRRMPRRIKTENVSEAAEAQSRFHKKRSNSVVPALPDADIDEIVSAEFVDVAQIGQSFMKHRWDKMRNRPAKKPHARTVRVVCNDIGLPTRLVWGRGASAHKSIEFSRVLSIEEGHKTPVFQGCRADPKLCFSVIEIDGGRTLDLEASNEHIAQTWIKGLRHMLDFCAEYLEEQLKGIGNRRLERQVHQRRKTELALTRTHPGGPSLGGVRLAAWKFLLIVGSKLDVKHTGRWMIGTVQQISDAGASMRIHFDEADNAPNLSVTSPSAQVAGSPVSSQPVSPSLSSLASGISGSGDEDAKSAENASGDEKSGDEWIRLDDDDRIAAFGTTEASRLIDHVRARNLTIVRLLCQVKPPLSSIQSIDDSNVVKEAVLAGAEFESRVKHHTNAYIQYALRSASIHIRPKSIILQLITAYVVDLCVHEQA